MFDEVMTWWQNQTPETHAAVQTASLVLAALLGGQFAGSLVARALRKRNFDAALRLPNSLPPGAEGPHGITPTFIAGLLVRLTVWMGAASWLARQQGRADIATTLGLILNRTWALAAVLVAALALGSLLTHRIMECLQGLPRAGADGSHSRNGFGGSARGVAGAVGAGVYGLVVLLVLLIAADLFDWPLTRSSALALWQLSQHLLIAGAALLIGSLGARWAVDVATPEGTASPEKRAGHYTALGIVAATTVLAVAVLLSGAGVLLGLATLAVLAFLLWLGRGYLPDVAAGLQLRAHKVREVALDGASWRVAEVGLVSTEVSRAGEFHRLQNRVLLDACLHGEPVEVGSR